MLLWNEPIFNNVESESIDVESQRFIVLADHQRYLAYGLGHRLALPKSRNATLC